MRSTGRAPKKEETPSFFGSVSPVVLKKTGARRWSDRRGFGVGPFPASKKDSAAPAVPGAGSVSHISARVPFTMSTTSRAVQWMQRTRQVAVSKPVVHVIDLDDGDHDLLVEPAYHNQEMRNDFVHASEWVKKPYNLKYDRMDRIQKNVQKLRQSSRDASSQVSSVKASLEAAQSEYEVALRQVKLARLNLQRLNAELAKQEQVVAEIETWQGKFRTVRFEIEEMEADMYKCSASLNDHDEDMDTVLSSQSTLPLRPPTLTPPPELEDSLPLSFD